MIVRNKSGEYWAGNSSALLDFLGVKQGAAGPQTVKTDVEVIAPVPFRLSAGAVADEGFAWTLSTFDLDRYGERIRPEGWDCKQYLANPVVEWAHRYDIPAIGRVDKLKIDNDGLHGLVFFNSKDYDPFGWGIGRRVQAGVIRAGSVGFRVIEVEIPDKETAKDGTTLIFRKQELLEFSICNVPANPFALTKHSEQLAMSSEEVKTETTQKLSGSMFWGGLLNF
jgi:HK97 family phage prohead protease